MSFTLPRSSPLPCRCSYVMLLPASPSWNMHYCDVLFFLSTTCWQRMESEGATCTWRPYPSFTGLQTRQLLPPWCRVQKHAANMKATGQSSSSGRSGCHPLLCWKINMTHRQIGEDEHISVIELSIPGDTGSCEVSYFLMLVFLMWLMFSVKKYRKRNNNSHT